MAKVHSLLLDSLKALACFFILGWFGGSCAGQCKELSLLECNCGSTIGLDESQVDCCDYFTRGRPEYSDFCGGCPSPEYHFSLFGGLSFATDLQREQLALPFDSIGASLDEGGLVGGALGRQWNSRLRTELEFTYRRNNSDTWFERDLTGGIASTISEVPADGFLERFNGMVNMTFDLVPRRNQMPGVYGGLGAGVSHGKGTFTTATDVFEVNDPAFAWQWILGGNFAVNPGLDLYTEYRFLQSDNFDVRNTTLGQSLGDFELDSHDIVFGFRFRR